MFDALDRKAQLEDFVRAITDSKVSRRELFARAAALGVGVSALGALGRAPASAEAAAPSATGRQAMQVVRLPEKEPTTFDPGVSSGGFGLEQLQNLFEGLVGVDQRNGQIEMHMAEKMVANDDASEFTFTLRDGMKWSDGTPITAADFEYSWKRVLMPETRSDYTSALLPIKGVLAFQQGKGSLDDVAIKATDSKTLKVGLEGATPYFPLLAATWTFYPVPKHIVEKNGEQWVEAGNMVSNGPYILKDWKHDQSMTAERNPNYWGQAPSIERVEWTLFSDPIAQALVAYENDELDQAQVQGADLDRVRNDPTLGQQLQRFPRSGTEFITLDTTNNPTSDVKLRQALSMAINRKTLAEQIMKGEFSAAYTMLPPDIPGYNADASLGEDVAKAKDLLAQVGSVPQLTIVYSTSQNDKTVCEYLQGAWRQNLGLDVKVEAMEAKAYRDWRNGRKTGSFHMYLSFWGSDWGDPANWHNQLFESSADFYFSHWRNAEFDRMVNTARTMTDVEKRTELYKTAEKLLVQEASVIPLFNLNRFYVIKPNVKNVVHYPILGRTFAKYIYVDKS